MLRNILFLRGPACGKLTRRHRALRPHRPEEGSGRESEFTRCLVALARPLIGALLEKHIT